MTTRITVDAHAGWPIEVIFRHGEVQSTETKVVLEIVQPNTIREFCVHSGLQIISIRELPRSVV